MSVEAETLRINKMKNNDLIIDVEWGLGTAYYYYGKPEVVDGRLFMTYTKHGKCSTFNGNYAMTERFIMSKIKAKFPNKNVYWKYEYEQNLNL